MSKNFMILYSCIWSIFIYNGCARDAEKILMEVVALNKNNPINFSLQVVEADPKDNPFSKDSDALELCSMMEVRLADISEVAKVSASFSELRSKLRERFGGKPTSLLVSKSDGIYRGSTYESILGLSAYYHLIEIMKFARKNELLKGLALEPLKVSLYGEIYATSLSDFPYPASDNALYIGSVDTLMLLPVGDNDGLPVPMHEGVLAHEFHHRIFFYKVFIHDEDKKSWARYKMRYEPKQNELHSRSERLLAATDEALADIFAVVYTKLPNYLCLSLTTTKGEEVCKQRDLNGDYAKNATYDVLAGRHVYLGSLGSCGINSKNFTSANFNYYCLATVIAKALYESVGGNLRELENLMLPAINRSLITIAKTLAKGADYDIDIFFAALAEDVKSIDADLHHRLCEQLKIRFSSLVKKGRIPSCEL
ncbi:MAG TPA: hypothetical protein VEK06_04685 [Myxococcota bacterium]|nr:hypothetical protein [Myxococcota bacterium]